MICMRGKILEKLYFNTVTTIPNALCSKNQKKGKLSIHHCLSLRVHIVPLQTLLWISKEYWKCLLSSSQSSLSFWSDAWHHFEGMTLTGYSHPCLRLPGLGEVATLSFLTTREHWLQAWQEKKHSEPLFPTFSPGEFLVIWGGGSLQALLIESTNRYSPN